jgi:hypothetical protein
VAGRRGDGACAQVWRALCRTLAPSVLPTLALDLTDSASHARAAEFVERMEADMRERLAPAPEPMLIPLAALV